MSEIEDFMQLKENVERKRQEVSRAEGGLEQMMKQLKEQHGCKTLEEAKSLLTQISQQADKDKIKFEKALKKFKDEYNDYL